MSLDRYSALQASVADWLNRTDLTAVIPDFITLCEADLRTRLKTKHTSILQATLAAGDKSIALPAYLLEIVSVAISGSTLGSALHIVSYEALLRYRVQYPTSAVPLFCAVVGDTLEFAPTPGGNYTLDIEVEGPFVPLSITAVTNWILEDYPHVYLFGALLESASYLKDDDRTKVWGAKYERALAQLAVARERWQFPGQLTRRLARVFG